jgi:hypothetical protein
MLAKAKSSRKKRQVTTRLWKAKEAIYDILVDRDVNEDTTWLLSHKIDFPWGAASHAKETVRFGSIRL